MDYLEGKAQSSFGSGSTPALARYDRQPLLPTSDDCNLQCSDYEIESNNMNLSSRSTQGDEIPKAKIELEGGGERSENEISDKSVTQEDDEAEENSDEEADATEVADMLSCADSSLSMPHPCRILQKYTRFGESDTHPSTFLKSPSNIADMLPKRKRYTSLRTSMKRAKGTTAYPIPAVRIKANLLKVFRDPAVVDQLLDEAVAGDVSPGGTHCLRRCRNAEGAIEYWVEDTDLVNIRKEAGVNDPYCVPSPGWRPGDCPTQQISILKREVELIAQTLEEFRKEVRALMEENLSMFSALRSEIKKKFLVEKEDEKQGMQGIVRKKEEEERSSDAQYETRDDN